MIKALIILEAAMYFKHLINLSEINIEPCIFKGDVSLNQKNRTNLVVAAYLKIMQIFEKVYNRVADGYFYPVRLGYVLVYSNNALG